MTDLRDFMGGVETLADGPRPVSELQGDPDTLHRLCDEDLFGELSQGRCAADEPEAIAEVRSWHGVE